MLFAISKNRFLKDMEAKIADALKQEDQYTDIDSALDYLASIFHEQFPMEYDNATKTVFYVIVISKFEEGVYDNEDDI